MKSVLYFAKVCIHITIMLYKYYVYRSDLNVRRIYICYNRDRYSAFNRFVLKLENILLYYNTYYIQIYNNDNITMNVINRK